MYLKRHASGSLPPKKWTPGKAGKFLFYFYFLFYLGRLSSDLRPTSLTGSSMAPYIYPALTDVGQTRAAGRLSIAHRPAFVKGDQERGRATNQTVEEDRRMELRAQVSLSSLFNPYSSLTLRVGAASPAMPTPKRRTQTSPPCSGAPPGLPGQMATPLPFVIGWPQE
jgi:hypothetical protein